MAHQIIKQPDGKYAIWSSIVDDFVITDCTLKEYIEFLIERESKRIRNEVEEIARKLENGEKPYYQFTKTYEEAVKFRNQIHKDKMEPVKKLEKV